MGYKAQDGKSARSAGTGRQYPRYTGLYEVLEVSPIASDPELRRAFRARMIELQSVTGNDFTGDEDKNDQFRLVKYAYEILGDPDKRQVYDQAGERAVRILETSIVILPQPWAMQALKVYAYSQWAFILLIFAVVGFVALVPILWCLRIDGTISWPYAIVAIPTWLLDIIIIREVSVSPVYLVPPLGLEHPALLRVWYQYRPFLYISLLMETFTIVALQISVVLYLDDVVALRPWTVMTPWFICEALNLLEALILALLVRNLKSAQDRELIARNTAGEHLLGDMIVIDTIELQGVRDQLQHKAEKLLHRGLVRIGTALLMCLKLEDILKTGWFIIFLPVYLDLGTEILMHILDLGFLIGLSTINGGKQEHSQKDEQELEKQRLKQIASASMMSGPATNQTTNGDQFGSGIENLGNSISKPQFYREELSDNENDDDDEEDDLEAPSVILIVYRVVILSCTIGTLAIVCILLRSHGSFSSLLALLPSAIIGGLFLLSLCCVRPQLIDVAQENRQSVVQPTQAAPLNATSSSNSLGLRARTPSGRLFATGQRRESSAGSAHNMNTITI